MAKCASPCSGGDGVCVGNGDDWSCQSAPGVVSGLLRMFNAADRIAFIPDDDRFTIAAVRRVFSRHKRFMISIRDDGALEIWKMPRLRRPAKGRTAAGRSSAKT